MKGAGRLFWFQGFKIFLIILNFSFIQEGEERETTVLKEGLVSALSKATGQVPNN